MIKKNKEAFPYCWAYYIKPIKTIFSEKGRKGKFHWKLLQEKRDFKHLEVYTSENWGKQQGTSTVCRKLRRRVKFHRKELTRETILKTDFLHRLNGNTVHPQLYHVTKNGCLDLCIHPFLCALQFMEKWRWMQTLILLGRRC